MTDKIETTTEKTVRIEKTEKTPIVKFDLDHAVPAEELETERRAAEAGDGEETVKRVTAERGVGAAISGVDVPPAKDR